MSSTEISRKDLNREGGCRVLAAEGPESKKWKAKHTCRTLKLSLGSFLYSAAELFATLRSTRIAATITAAAATTTKQQNNNNSNSSNNIIINNNKAKSRCAQARSSPSGYTLRLGHLEMQCTAVASWGQRCFISESIQALPIASSVFNFSNLQILQSESQFKLSWSLHF